MGCNTSKNGPIGVQTPRASSAMPLQLPTDTEHAVNDSLTAATELSACMSFLWNSLSLATIKLNNPLGVSYLEHF